MKTALPLAVGLLLSACVTTSVTPISQPVTTEPIVIEAPVAAVPPSTIDEHPVHSARVVTHDADTSLKSWQRIEKANQAARVEPGLENYRNAVQVYSYTEGAIYALYAAPGKVSVISLEAGEELVSVSAGDTANWIVGDTVSGSGGDAVVTILIKPVAPGLTTNLVITTTKRTYLLELTSFRTTAMAALSWDYPEDRKTKTRPGRAGSPGIVLDPAELNFRYVIAGDRPDWRPLRAFDDGRKTYLEFPEDFEVGLAPPLYVTGGTGEIELVNYRVKSRYYIVDRLFRSAELRIGTSSQEIIRIIRVDEEEARDE